MNSRFYKIVLIDRCVREAAKARQSVFDQLVAGASGDQFDATARVLAHIGMRESTMISKILAFDTSDVDDYDFNDFGFYALTST